MKHLLLLLSFWAFLNGDISFADEKSIWVEAEGEAYLGLHDTPHEIMERAKREAEKKAIENGVGVFIQSHSFVSNSQLVDDLIYARVRGRISKVDIVDQRWDEKDRSLYKVKIKGRIDPIYPEQGQGLSVKLFLSKNNVKEGEAVKIFYQVKNDCYVYIFSVGCDGSVTLLLPNSINKDNFAEPGQTYEFPPATSAIQLQARFIAGYERPVAEEKIKIIATKKREALIPLGFQEGAFTVYDAKSTGMISDLVKRLNQLEPSEWAEATIPYAIHK